MELAVEPSIFIILCVVSFVAGFVDAIAGGGGLLTLPALIATGLPPHIALGTNKVAATFGTFTASLAFYKNKLFSPSFWKLSIITTITGSIIGTLVISHISTDSLEKAVPVMVVLVAIYTLMHKPAPDSDHSLPEQTPELKAKQLAQGTTLGFYDGVFGPGTGAFWTVSSVSMYKTNLLISSGVARTMNFFSNISSLTTFVILGHYSLLIGIGMGFSQMAGAWMGAHSAIKLGSKFIRPVFITIVIIMAIKLGYDAWA